MKSNLALAIEFSQKIKKIPGILQIILFGSVARGEDTFQSDIDIAIIYDHKDKFLLTTKINQNKPPKIQITVISINNIAKETELVGALEGEGILLYGKPIIIQQKKLELISKILISYSLAALPQTEKVKVNRMIYGSVSRSTSHGKEYTTTTKGFVGQPGIEKINDGVLLIERRLATKVITALKRFGCQVKEIAVWTY